MTGCTEVECQPTLDILICVNRRRFIQGGAIVGTDSASSQISTGQSASAAQPLMQIRVARPTLLRNSITPREHRLDRHHGTVCRLGAACGWPSL